MKIQLCHVRDVLTYYGITENIKNVDFLLDDYSKSLPLRVKVICKVELDNNSLYIVKFVLEEEHPETLIEEQSIFSECLRKNGINTAKRLKYLNKYCTPYTIEDLTFSVTVEEYLGQEVTTINYDTVKEIAILVAKMHKISELNNCHINNNTIWDIFDSESDIMRGYKQFCEFESKINGCNLYNVDLYNKIIKLYNKRIDFIKSLWDKLPKYATQGDFSINNLTYIEGQLGIFDYNISGDEVLVSDMIIEGLFVTLIMDLSQNLNENDRPNLFDLFVKTYMENRKLSNEEISVMNHIYAIILPFWWTNIIFKSDDSLLGLINNNEVNKVNIFLEKTYKLLSTNYFDNLL